jgi:hypothetical protein
MTLHAKPIRRTASFDRSKRYRYALLRCWDQDAPRLAMCLLNPSTADHRRDDPTIRRCIRFAQRWGYGSLEVVNIFAWRSTHPGVLYELDDPVGPGNDTAIARAVRRSNAVHLAWGEHGSLLNRGPRVERTILRIAAALDLPVTHFARTRSGQPKHPLYLAAETPPIPVC